MQKTTLATRIARVTAALAVAGALAGGAGVALAQAADAAPARAALTTLAPASGEYQGGDDSPVTPVDASTAAEAPPPVADPAPAAAAPALTASGAVTGDITATQVSCTQLGGGNYSWELLGTVGATPVQLTFTTTAYDGADSYRTTGITDEHGGLATLKTETVGVASNGNEPGTFVVDAGEQTGSIDADLFDNDTSVHVTGTWSCTG